MCSNDRKEKPMVPTLLPKLRLTSNWLRTKIAALLQT
jgi:hypothetical protein